MGFDNWSPKIKVFIIKSDVTTLSYKSKLKSEIPNPNSEISLAGSAKLHQKRF